MTVSEEGFYTIKDLTLWWLKSKAKVDNYQSLDFSYVIYNEDFDWGVGLHMKNFKKELLDEYVDHRIQLCYFLINKIEEILFEHNVKFVKIFFEEESFIFKPRIEIGVGEKYHFFDKE